LVDTREWFEKQVFFKKKTLMTHHKSNSPANISVFGEFQNNLKARFYYLLQCDKMDFKNLKTKKSLKVIFKQ